MRETGVNFRFSNFEFRLAESRAVLPRRMSPLKARMEEVAGRANGAPIENRKSKIENSSHA
jgi:hypothetical protein